MKFAVKKNNQKIPTEFVTLVDRKGNRTGQAEKLAAHQNGGHLHLAFSIFVLNARKELLLQKRAKNKYHFANLWSNTCCGHPRPNEEIDHAAQRRLNEEFGFTTELQTHFSLVYEAYDDVTGLTEKEFLHVLIGCFNGTPQPEPKEVGEWCWQPISSLRRKYDNNPQSYTPWFGILLPRVVDYFKVTTRPPQHKSDRKVPSE